MLRRVLLIAALALPAVPAVAATPSSVLHRAALTADQVVGLTDERLVGVSWTAGSPTVSVRWHSTQGWSGWEVADQDSAPQGLPGTEPLWRPAGADRVELRTTGAARGLRLLTVADTVKHTLGGARAQAATGRDVLGQVHSRAEWGADESQRRGKPEYAPRVNAVIVHHTVNANGYGANDVPSLIRADYAYHVQGRGWDDLGYNLLVDQFGRVWEGRYGGLGRATVGSHAGGFNDGTLGVAMIGDMTKTTASPLAEKALARVIGYAARTWGFEPTGSVTLTSKGSPRYAAGQRVTFPRVIGHQQTGRTACPGSVQDRLPALRSLAVVALRAAPVITSVALSGAPVHAPSAMSVDARLSLAAGWTATLTDPTGAVVAAGKGTTAAPTVSWDGQSGGLPAAPGTYRWVVTADDGFHPAVQKVGTFEVGLPLLPV